MLREKLSSGELERLFTKEEDDNCCKNYCLELISGIVNGQWTILEIVEILQNFLTSTDLTRHKFGLDFLANVVETLPNDFLLEKELEFIAEFFCGQVKQHHSFITPALKGLVALVRHPLLARLSLINVTTTLFSNVVWQTQTLTDRRMFYMILQYIVFNCLEDYKTCCSELLFNIISSVDGERDPRNLLLLFSFLPKLYTTITLGPLTEDAFEVVSCYFPIDFHSQAGDSGSVTREDLVSALYPCLLAHPDFATLCIPLIQEKLESSLKSAKIDSYNLAVEGMQIWPSDVVAPHIEPLWQAIKTDVLPPRDAQIAEVAIRALQAVVKTTNEPYLSSLLSYIWCSCEVFLSDVQLSMFEPSFRLLLIIMQASLPVCSILSQKLLPKLISLLKATQETSRNLVLNKLTAFLEVCLQMNPALDLGGEVWQEVVMCTDQEFPDMWQTAYSALTAGVSHLDSECRVRLYRNMVAHLTSVQSKSLRSSCMKCLQAMAVMDASEVERLVLTNLSLQTAGEKELTQVQNVFEAVCSLGIVEKFHPVIEQQFNYLVSRGEPYVSLAILCLRNLLDTEEIKNNNNLLKFLFSQSSVMDTLFSIQAEGDELLNSASIVRILVGSQNPSDQARCVHPYAKNVLQQTNQIQQMVFLESLISPLWSEVTILTLEEIRMYIIPVALHSFESELSRTAALQLLSSVINKSNDNAVLELVSQNMSCCTPHQISAVCAYITKALVLRNHPLMEHWIDKLVNLLDSEEDEVSQAAAESFHFILQESVTFLNHQSHCIVKLLYRQRLFYIVLPRLVQSTGNIQHLKTLAYLLQAVPYTVYMSHIKEIIPMLVKSLDIDSESLILTVLRTLTHLLSTNDAFLQDHVDTFIPRFVHLARKSLFMQVRIAALKCLCSSLKFSPILLLPHKQQVIAELVHCLDDKKRLVRKEAARTRSRWFLLGAPTAD